SDAVAQKSGQNLCPPPTHKILEVPLSSTLPISDRTRSKGAVAKSVQTEPAMVTVGTNTYSVSFDKTATSPIVTEFESYRMSNPEFTWSEAHDKRNACIDYYARLLGTDWLNKKKKKRVKDVPKIK
ncbi:MAG: hypothetical protein GY847_27820, partial [Proteobacteria bacterium]|nr:hypothetical protein [Pseudomonadota bacterium]